jgi:hypothetical protein
VVLRTLSQARAWRPAVVARLARTLGCTKVKRRLRIGFFTFVSVQSKPIFTALRTKTKPNTSLVLLAIRVAARGALSSGRHWPGSARSLTLRSTRGPTSKALARAAAQAYHPPRGPGLLLLVSALPQTLGITNARPFVFPEFSAVSFALGSL